jgi:hypothetical protein
VRLKHAFEVVVGLIRALSNNDHLWRLSSLVRDLLLSLEIEHKMGLRKPPRDSEYLDSLFAPSGDP